jgi:hypothetical protein
MALDDFTPASEAPDLDAPSPALPAEGDDLFDFAEEDEARAELDAEQPPAPIPASDPREACTGLDPELDVDLFGFPPMDLSSLGIQPSKPAAPEPPVEASSGALDDLLEEDLEGDLPGAPQRSSAPADPVPASAVREPEPAPAAAPRPEGAAAAPAPTPVVVQSVATAGPASKAIWVLTAAVVVFLFGMLGVAWRATSTFQQQLQQVRTEVDASADRIGQRTAAELRLLVAERERAAQRVDEPAGTSVPALEPLHETSLAVAEEALEEGRFAAARRTLFQLLAEADRLPSGQRAAVERRAAYLIARSHKVEADRLEESDQ